MATGTSIARSSTSADRSNTRSNTIRTTTRPPSMITIYKKNERIFLYIIMTNIHQRFANGLRQHNLTYDEVVNNWKYCGGTDGRHLNYFNLCCKDKEMPDHNPRCICGQKITENCFITDDKTILVVGNCCIKRFMSKSGRTCEQCGKPHKNRKVNLCNGCRTDKCIKCNGVSNSEVCYRCAVLGFTCAI